MSGDGVKPENPFPGLRPFRTEEHHLFFGREEQTAELLRLLGDHRFLAVVGTSGSGKSSLVRAGLIPALHRGTLSRAGSTWEVLVQRPGGAPIANLARALVQADLYDPDDAETLPRLAATLQRSRNGLVEAVKQSRELPAGTNLLVVVDQFEELFRFRQQGADSEEAATAFVSLLLTASEATECPIYIAITVRSDYLGDCSEIPGLAEAVNRGEYLIPRLLRDQKREAIEMPVGVGGASISSRLVQRMLNRVGDDPDQLPVLQHALMRTWEVWAADHAEGEAIDLRHFEATGGMEEALSRHADEVYEALPTDGHRSICERVFKALTEKATDNRGIRRPARLAALEKLAGCAREPLLAVLEAFRRPGVTFLMPGLDRELEDQTVIDLSHESLMRVWRRLRGWVEEEAQSARIFARLTETAALWKAGQASLFRDPDLQIAASWRDASRPNEAWAAQYGGGFTVAMEFLDRSSAEARAEERAREARRQRELEQARALAEAEQHRAEERERSARRFKVLAGGIAVIAVLAALAFFQAREARVEADHSAALAAEKAQEARQSAELATRNEVAATEAAAKLQGFLARHDFDVGGKLIEEGNAAQGLAHIARALRTDPSLAPAQQRAMASLASGRFHLKDIPIIEQERPISGFWVNQKEELLLTSDNGAGPRGEDTQQYVWDLRTGERLYRVERDASAQWQLDWSPDGQRLHGLQNDGKSIVAWDARSGKKVGSITSEAGWTRLRLGDHRELGPLLIAWRPEAGTIQVLHALTGAAITPVIARSDAPCAAAFDFSPDGTLFWHYLSNHILMVRETATGRSLLEVQGRRWSRYTRFSPDQRFLLTIDAGDGRSVGWWRIPRELLEQAPQEGGGAAPVAADLSRDPWVAFRDPVYPYLLPAGDKVALISRGNAPGGGSSQRLEVSVYDLATRERLATFAPRPAVPGGPPGLVESGEVLSVGDDEWGPTLRFPLMTVCETSAPSSVSLWDLETGQTLPAISTPWFLQHAALTPEGRRVVTLSRENQLMLWDVFDRERGMLLPRPIELEGSVDVVFSPDGEKLLTSQFPQNIVEFRDSRTGERLLEPLLGTHFNVALFSPRGDRVALYDRDLLSNSQGRALLVGGRLSVVDLGARPLIFEPLLPEVSSRYSSAPREFSPSAARARFTSDGSRMVASGRKRPTAPLEILILDARSRAELRSVPLPDGVSVNLLEVGLGGRLAIVGSTDQRVRLIDLESGAIAHEVFLDSSPSALQLASDGQRAAIGTEGGQVLALDLATGARIGGALDHGTLPITHIALSPDGRWIGSGSADFHYRISDASTGQEALAPLQLNEMPGSIIYLKGGREALLLPFAAKAHLIELPGGRELRTIQNDSMVLASELSPDGRTLALGGGGSNRIPSGGVALWDAETGLRRGGALEHRGQVGKVQWSPDGSLLATGTNELTGIVRVWDVASGRQVMDPVSGTGDVTTLGFSPDGALLLAAWGSGGVRVIDLPPRSNVAPPWLARLAEAVGGKRFVGESVSSEAVPRAEIAQARVEVEAAVSGTSGDGASALAGWARWFLADPQGRTTSPGSRRTLAEHRARLRGSAQRGDLEKSLLYWPADGITHARLGAALVEEVPTETALDAAGRRHWRDTGLGYLDRATELEPEEPEVWALRARALEKLGRPEAASEALARAAALATTVSANVSYLQALRLSRSGEQAEADAAFDQALAAVLERSANEERHSFGAPLLGILPYFEPARPGLDFRDLELPEPIAGTFEDFDSTPAGQTPVGWTTATGTGGGWPLTGGASLEHPERASVPGWYVQTSGRVPGWAALRPQAPGRIGGRIPVLLLEGGFLQATAREAGAASGERAVETPDFDLSGREDVHLVFQSGYRQVEQQLGIVEYSVDGGTTWLPAAYYLDGKEAVRDPAGGIDAVETLTRPRPGLPWTLDDGGRPRGHRYADYVRAPVDSTLGPFVVPLRAGGTGSSRSLEVLRLAGADGQPRVRVRFAFVGPSGAGGRLPPGDSASGWGIDRVGLYELPRGIPPSSQDRLDLTGEPAVLAGVALKAFLGRPPTSALGAALDPRDLQDLEPASPELGAAQWLWVDASLSAGTVLFRRSFEVQGALRAAHLLAAGAGSLELSLNDEVLLESSNGPKLQSRLITSHLRPGHNVLAMKVSEADRSARGASTPGLLFRLELAFEDGTIQTLVSDGSTRAASPASEAQSWRAVDFDGSGWAPARTIGLYGAEPWGRFADSSRATEEMRSAAVLLARRAARLGSHDRSALLAASYVSARAGRLEDAIAQARTALELGPLDTPLAGVLAAVWTRQGDELKEAGHGDRARLAYELAYRLGGLASTVQSPAILGRLASVGLALENRRLIARGSRWRYLDDGPYPADDWTGLEFDDAAWREGPARLGYGDGIEKTVVRYGRDPQNRRLTTHFRAAFEIDDPGSFAQLQLRLQIDDGAVVYLNGREVLRHRMPGGKIGPTTTAAEAAVGTEETEFAEFDLFSAPLRAGRNVVAVEVHQAGGNSSDLGFDLELEGVGGLAPAALVDAPGLERAESELGLEPWSRALLWISRARSLRQAGLLAPASDALGRAATLAPDAPHVLLEKALEDDLRGDDESAYTSFLQAVQGAIALKRGPEVSGRLLLPPLLRDEVEPLLGEDSLALATIAGQWAESKRMEEVRGARWLLRRCEELGGEHEPRLAAANAWLALDPSRAVSLAEAALAAQPPSKAAPSPRALRELRDWLRLRELGLRALGRNAEAATILEELLTPAPRPEGLSPKLIDLSGHYTASLSHGGWPYSEIRDTNLRYLGETFRPRDGITFDLRGLIQLNSGVYEGASARAYSRGKDVAAMGGRSFPDSVAGISVAQKASSLHFLLGAVWGQAMAGEEVAQLLVRFEDETTATIPVRFVVDVDDWNHVKSTEIDVGRVGWMGLANEGVLCFLTRLDWSNPAPEKTIAQLDFVSMKKNAGPFLVAITAR